MPQSQQPSHQSLHSAGHRSRGIVALACALLVAPLAVGQSGQSPDPLGELYAPAGGSSVDLFGFDIAIAPAFAVVGAPQVPVTQLGGGVHLAQGGVHIYRDLGDGEFEWTRSLTPLDGKANDWCGTSVAATARRVVGGGPGRDLFTTGNQLQAGVAWVWTEVDGVWVDSPAELRHQSPKALDLFGSSVDIAERVIDGVLHTSIAIAAPVDDEPGRTDCGSVTLFEWQPLPAPLGTWVQTAFIAPPTLPSQSIAIAAYGVFGSAVAFDGDYLFIGAKRQTDSVIRQGLVWVFRRNTVENPAPTVLQTNAAWGEWCLVQRLESANPKTEEQFGASLAAQGGMLIVGAPGADTEPGSATIFEYSTKSGTYLLNAQISAAGGQIGDRFGASVSIAADTALVGAPGIDVGSDPIFPNRGAVIIFARNDDQCETWSQRTKYRPPTGANVPEAAFGESIELTTNMVLIGAPHAPNQVLGQGTVFSYEIDTVACYTDLDGNGFTDSPDLTILLGHWMNGTPDGDVADFNQDGDVDGKDLTELLSNWGPCICPVP